MEPDSEDNVLSSGSGSWASNETSYVLVIPNYYSVKWEITYSP
jgi:hypothetical protein